MLATKSYKAFENMTTPIMDGIVKTRGSSFFRISDNEAIVLQ